MLDKREEETTEQNKKKIISQLTLHNSYQKKYFRAKYEEDKTPCSRQRNEKRQMKTPKPNIVNEYFNKSNSLMSKSAKNFIILLQNYAHLCFMCFISTFITICRMVNDIENCTFETFKHIL